MTGKKKTKHEIVTNLLQKPSKTEPLHVDEGRLKTLVKDCQEQSLSDKGIDNIVKWLQQA